MPNEACTCGFYCTYYPSQDFFERSDPMPRAVVEVEGRIILAEKGFRAERMKIIAVSTQRLNQTVLHSNYVHNDFVRKGISDTLLLKRKLKEALSDSHIEVFESDRAMYRAYPQSDLSNLLPAEILRKK